MLQIAVDDAFLVRGIERLRDLMRNGQRFLHGNRAAADALGQRVAVD
jgi:hypothetical protein